MAGKQSMGDAPKEEMLHMSAEKLTQAAREITSKIKEQGYVIENITNASKHSINKFDKNSQAFDVAVENLENDKRSTLILALIVVLVILMYYLKVN